MINLIIGTLIALFIMVILFIIQMYIVYKCTINEIKNNKNNGT